MLVPVIPVERPKDPKEEIKLPEDGNCFLIGKNGVFHQVKNPFYKVITKVEGPSGLAELKEEIKLGVIKMGLELFKKAEAFLHAAWKKHDGEAIILLAYNIQTKEWKLIIPKQKASGSFVEYDQNNVELPAGFSMFGTIHSHPTFDAFHSGTDDKDEYNFDGLHITVGFLNRPTHAYAARWMLNGKAFKCELADAVEGAKEEEIDKSWLDCVEKKQYGGHSSPVGSGTGMSGGEGDDYYKRNLASQAGTSSSIKKEDRPGLIRRGYVVIDLPAHQLKDEDFDLLNIICSDLGLLQEVLEFDPKKAPVIEAAKVEAQTTTVKAEDSKEDKEKDEVLQKAADFQDTLQDVAEQAAASGNVATATLRTPATESVVDESKKETVRMKGGIDVGVVIHGLKRKPKNWHKRG